MQYYFCNSLTATQEYRLIEKNKNHFWPGLFGLFYQSNANTAFSW